MAITGPMVWEVRPTGNDANGGGFDPISGVPGTDYSRQDAPQVIHTDAVIGTPNTTATSAANPYTGAHVGNVENWTSGTGWTVQPAQVMSVASGVATFDKALGTSGSTGGNGRLGGAMASPGAAAGRIVAGNVVHWQSGTYPTANGTANTSGNRVNSSVVASWFGYAVTRRDNGTPPRLQASASNMTLFTLSGSPARVENVEAYRDPAGGLTGVIGFTLSGVAANARRLFCTNMNGANAILISGDKCNVLDSTCVGSNCSTGTFYPSFASGVTFEGCVDKGRTGGLSFAGAIAGGVRHVKCIVDGNAVAAIGFNVASNSPNAQFIECIAYNTGAAAGFAPYTDTYLRNCITHTTGGYLGNGGGSGVVMRKCAAYNGTTISGGILSNEGFIACTQDPFVAAGSDFRPNALPGGGALLRGSGDPVSLPGYPTITGAPDVGVYQHADAAAASGVYRRRIRPLGV